MKRIAALPGQTVCRIGRNVSVDTIAMGEALARDRRGRELPVWQGCRTLGAGEIFLMNWDVQDSLDGRYSSAPRQASRGASARSRSMLNSF